MNQKFSECQTPFTKCWCEAVPARMNNQKCQSLIPSVSIQSDVLTFIIVSAIVAYVFIIFKKKGSMKKYMYLLPVFVVNYILKKDNLVLHIKNLKT